MQLGVFESIAITDDMEISIQRVSNSNRRIAKPAPWCGRLGHLCAHN